jgi:thioredoxin reductase (NADPH)
MPFRLMTENGREYECDALIIATGSSARWLNIESEKKFKGKGISTCATCDGFFFRDKEVAIIGGGNTAVTEALFLAEIAKKVTIVHRRDEFRAEPTLVARLKEFKNIEIIWDSEVEEFLGDEKLEKIKLKNMKSNEESEINVDGAFLAIGHKPNTTMVEGELELDKKGYIVTKDNSTKTSVTGVFAAGDVQNIGWHQAITAAGFGCIAALEAQDYFMKK